MGPLIPDRVVYRMTNRERAKEPRGWGYWCFSCDACLVTSGGKCRGCGSRQKGKVRFKAGKPTPK